MPYQLSYQILVERSIKTNLIVCVDLIVNQAEYQNAGQQCVAMSLCSLFYNNTQGISSANDLIQKMDIRNQLYSSLS